MPPAGGLGVNITTAYGALDTSWLDSIGMLSETDLRARLNRSGDEAVLIYFYNPMRPLALTGASLDAFATPFDNVIVLKARAEASDEPLGLLIVSLDRSAFADWAHINVDRYLAGRIGQAPITDLRTDLAFSWAYPVFDVFPAEENLELQGAVSADLLISWRSRNPDPPSPWSFFVTSDSEAVVITPDNFPLNPQSPPQTVTVTIDRSGLLPGEYTATLFIQPFSDTFGLIRQTVERTITFTVDETPPTPTPGPITEIVLSPIEPREGDNLSVSAEGFLPGESVLIELVGESRSIRDALPTASETGAFDYTIDLDTVPRGEYTLTLLGSQSFIRAEVSVLILEAIADAVVSRDELNLRFCPSFDCPVVEILARGDELTVIAVNSDDTWLEVTTTTGYQGWVLTNLVDLNIDLSTVPWNPNPPASP
jgi:hypothetical protein